VVPGWAGGGNWLDETLPDGAAGNGAGCVESIEEKRVLEQPASATAATERAARPSLETIIWNLRGPVMAVSAPLTKMAKVAEFQPDMVKIGFWRDFCCRSAAYFRPHAGHRRHRAAKRDTEPPNLPRVETHRNRLSQ
jgi:hypothetical protein